MIVPPPRAVFPAAPTGERRLYAVGLPRPVSKPI